MVIRSDGCRVHPCIMFREGLLVCDWFLFWCQFLLQVSHVSPRVIVSLEQHSGARQGIAHSGQRLVYYGCVMQQRCHRYMVFARCFFSCFFCNVVNA